MSGSMGPSRILFFISSLACGGAENHLLSLARLCKGMGWEVGICSISPTENELDNRVLLDGISLYRVPLESLWELMRVDKLRAIRKVLSVFHPDIIHAHLFHAEVVAYVASVVAHVPLVVTRHSYHLEFNGIRRILIHLLQKRYSRVIAVSSEIAREARELGAGGEKVVVIENAVDTDRFRPLEDSDREVLRERLLKTYFGSGVSEKTVVIATVGGLKRVKNFSLFIEIASELVTLKEVISSGIDLRFLIVGEGELRRELEKIISESGLSDNVVLTGFIDRMEEMYPLFDILVITSSSEGLPLTLLEAMSCGVACVASSVGGIGDVLEGCGLVAPAGSRGDFVSAIRSLILDPAKRMEIGRKARVRVLERFNEDTWGYKIFSIYQDILGERTKTKV